MISLLFAAICITQTVTGDCEERIVLVVDKWAGPEAPAQCDADRRREQIRLEREGGGEKIFLYCESEPA